MVHMRSYALNLQVEVAYKRTVPDSLPHFRVLYVDEAVDLFAAGQVAQYGARQHLRHLADCN